MLLLNEKQEVSEDNREVPLYLYGASFPSCQWHMTEISPTWDREWPIVRPVHRYTVQCQVVVRMWILGTIFRGTHKRFFTFVNILLRYCVNYFKFYPKCGYFHFLFHSVKLHSAKHKPFSIQYKDKLPWKEINDKIVHPWPDSLWQWVDRQLVAIIFLCNISTWDWYLISIVPIPWHGTLRGGTPGDTDTVVMT